jgi:hypothetical protein
MAKQLTVFRLQRNSTLQADRRKVKSFLQRKWQKGISLKVAVEIMPPEEIHSDKFGTITRFKGTRALDLIGRTALDRNHQLIPLLSENAVVDNQIESKLMWLLAIHRRRGGSISLKDITETKIREMLEDIKGVEAFKQQYGSEPHSSSVDKVFRDAERQQRVDIPVLRHLMDKGMIDDPEIASEAMLDARGRVERSMIEIIQRESVDVIVVFRYLNHSREEPRESTSQ